jgi:uncharacterized protein YajQ (UPF0234 family)
MERRFGTVRQRVTSQQGSHRAKEVVKAIKDAKIKVQEPFR